VYAGWRSSAYGHQQDRPPSYWVYVAEEMASRFPGSQPSGIWIAGFLRSDACHLQFPNRDETNYPGIEFASTDLNERYLDAFDDAGVKVWLQVEPGDANVETLIDLVLNEYKHHGCIIGFGVDVEWLESGSYNNGRSVTNVEAAAWLSKVKSHNPEYKLFLKHWRSDKMPTAHPAEIVYIDDSCDYADLNEMTDEFILWGKAFSNAEVGFQIGYDLDTNGDGLRDRDWWIALDDPPEEIGDALISKIPNCRYVYWVDFTILEVFP
jgi:hypothetical protein